MRWFVVTLRAELSACDSDTAAAGVGVAGTLQGAHTMQALRYLWLVAVLTFAVAHQAVAEPFTISGTVVDAGGKTLAGAEVWLLRIDTLAADEPTATATRADAEGNFIFADVDAPFPTPEYAMLTVAAYKAPLALGWVALREKSRGLQVRCLPATPVAGRVVGPDGKGLPATLSPAFITPEPFDPDGPGQLFLSPDLVERFSAHCDAEGHYALTCVPPDCRADLRVVAPGYGRHTTENTQPIAPVLELKAPGRAELQLSCTDKPEVAAGLRVRVWGNNRGLTYFSDRKADDRGHMALDELQPGRYSVLVAVPSTSPWQVRGPVDIQVNAGATTELEVRLERASLVKGRVLDEESGEPVAGAVVSPVASDMMAKSDDEGRYSLYLLPGEAQISASPPGGPSWPGDATATVTVLVAAQDSLAPDLRVKRALMLEGLVVDQEGRPVAGATVHRSSDLFARQRVQSDGQGRFVLESVGAGKEVTVWAQCGDAIMPQELTFKGNAAPRPLRLTLTPTRPVRLRVKVVDQDGRPVAGAGVMAQWLHQPLSKNVDLGATDANGTCVSEPQTAFGAYRLRVKTGASDAASSAEWAAVAGATHDFGVLQLTLAAGTMAGRVVDQAGRPVVGATVFNSGDAPRKLTAVSDRQGCFGLTGLYPGRAFVFAEAPGFRFTGACASTGAADLVLRLTPLAKIEASSTASRLSPPQRDENELRAAREILLLALAQPPDSRTGHLLGMLATIDPEGAKKRSAQALGRYDADIALELGKHLLAAQPDEALAYFEKVGDVEKYLHCQVYAAAALVAIDPVRARRQFEKAVPLAQTERDEGLRAVYLARLGAAMLPLDRALGEAALRRAEKLVEAEVERDSAGVRSRCQVAGYLAQLDLDAAQELMQRLRVGKAEASYYGAELAAAVAEVDPKRAERLLLELPAGERSERTLRVSYAMAPHDPERAIRLAHQIDDREHALTRRRTLAYLAYALHRDKPALARSLFEEAVAGLEARPGLAASAAALPPPPPGFGSSEAAPFPQSPVLLTELAVIGKQIGYPLAGDLAWRAVATRTGASDSLYAEDWYEKTGLPVNLALVAPEIGRDLAAIQLSRPYKAGDSWPQDELRSAALTALLVADPRGGPATLAALDRSATGLSQLSSTRLYDQAVKWLLADPVQRPATILSRFGFWSPGTDEDRWW